MFLTLLDATCALFLSTGQHREYESVEVKVDNVPLPPGERRTLTVDFFLGH